MFYKCVGGKIWFVEKRKVVEIEQIFSLNIFLAAVVNIALQNLNRGSTQTELAWIYKEYQHFAQY